MPAFLTSCRLPLLIAMTALLAGCQSLPTAQSEVSAQARFDTYRTFAVLAPSPRADRITAGDHVRLSGPMRLHLEQRLGERGLVPASPDVADLVFEIVGVVTPEISFFPSAFGREVYYGARTMGRYPLSGFYANQPIVVTTDRGVLSVIAYSPRQREIVWAAWMEGEYRPGEKVDTVKTALDALLAQLPPR